MKKNILLPVLFWIACHISAQSFVYLHQFSAGDGWAPNALIQGADSKIYGTTGSGGTNGDGTVFSLNPDGSGFVVLHYFASYASNGNINTNQDGIEPSGGGLIQGSDGKLYGITDSGATNGYGTIYSMNTSGSNFMVLRYFDNAYAFDPNHPNIDGRNPSGLTQGNDGWLYGICPNGGTNGAGCIFKMNTNGSSYSVLHYFGSGTNDGINGSGKLVQGSDGTLFGVTFHGTSYTQGGHDGTIFRLNTDGSSYIILHQFNGNNGGADSQNPEGVIQGSDNRLYGITFWGTIFGLDSNGSNFLVLHTYTNGVSTQGNTIIQASDGKLYGKTQGGGLGEAAGSHIFSLNTDGTAFNYVYIPNGNSTANLTQGKDGALYGENTTDPNSYYGTVYKLPANILQIGKAESGRTVVLWPTWANGYYALQTNNSLFASGWAAVSSGVSIVTNNLVLTNIPNGSSEFFRLH